MIHLESVEPLLPKGEGYECWRSRTKHTKAAVYKLPDGSTMRIDVEWESWCHCIEGETSEEELGLGNSEASLLEHLKRKYGGQR